MPEEVSTLIVKDGVYAHAQDESVPLENDGAVAELKEDNK